MKKIVLLRHFPTTYNDEGKIMADKYDMEPIQTNQTLLNQMKCSAVRYCQIAYSSPAKRAYYTAKQLFDCDVIIDNRISPREIGDWAGLTLQDIYGIAPDAIIKEGNKLRFNLSYAPPGAESNETLLTRLNSFIEMLYTSPYECIGVATHSMICCMLLALFNHTKIETATIDYIIEFYKAYEIEL